MIEKWDECESNWMKWSENDVFHWIRYKLEWLQSKDRTYDATMIANQITKRKINGDNLDTIDSTELCNIGMIIVKDRGLILNDIQSMIRKYPRINLNSEVCSHCCVIQLFAYLCVTVCFAYFNRIRLTRILQFLSILFVR